MPRRADPTGAVGCAQVREWIDPYLDDLDDLDELNDRDGTDEPEAMEGFAPADRTALEAHAADCPACRSEIALARRLRRELRDGLPLLACPPEVSDAVLRIAREKARAAERAASEPARPGLGARLRDGLDRLRAAGALRPALATAALLLLLIAGPLLYRMVIDPSAGEPDAAPAVAEDPAADPAGRDFTAAEVAAAEEQARQVLAYVASVSRDAGRAVQEDVFDPGIVRPTREVVSGLQAAGLAPDRDAPEAPDAAGRNRP